MDYANLDSICNVCGGKVYPGEAHLACNTESELKAVNQCIFCLKDERVGDHSECQDRIAKFRYDLISFFKS